MISAVIACFVIGYLLIVFEHPLRLDKTVPALLMASITWALLSLGHMDTFIHSEPHSLKETLLYHLGKTSEILIFLIGAMTIVEIIDLHQGFDILKDLVTTKSKKKLLWIVCGLGFILSAIIDNLTATIVLVTLLRKLVVDKNDRLWFVSMVVIAANAGGAWSPIGDVTTTMLWIGNKVSTLMLIEKLIVPSLICMAVPTFVASYLPAFQGKLNETDLDEEESKNTQKLLSSRTILILGLSMIVFVPVFKTITHLPPYLGMMLSLGVVWLVSEYIHPEEDFNEDKRHLYSAHKALSRIEMSSILFFLGILMAVGALESVELLQNLAEWLDKIIPNREFVAIFLGVFSAIIDNVPLVAASMSMYTLPLDHDIWHFIAFSAGTGGSMLIIGSAAGVAAMGMERISFIWYLKKITWLAAIGFIAGCGFILIEDHFLGALFH
ncbi:sodium:proton antiporter NhaD [Membranihabitans maritimus]|uniref:sodium:proton antiporter NhaD n=1 Tax=Membranihabitans maritimus TaxID=2904244 RepID=UPI001F010259|nr:sodium:proton antiporter NhaD [Membranihabitans maritimus]